MQEYDVESHRLSSMTRSQDEINRLTDQLDDNDVRLKLQTEIWRLVDRIVLHMKIQKFIIYYHTPKWVVRFKSGKSTLFIDRVSHAMPKTNVLLQLKVAVLF